MNILHEEIVGLDISVDEAFAVNVLYPGDELVGEEQHRFQTESSRAKVEQVLQTWPEQLHDHHVEVSL